jgi:hypothetical protein
MSDCSECFVDEFLCRHKAVRIFLAWASDMMACWDSPFEHVPVDESRSTRSRGGGRSRVVGFRHQWEWFESLQRFQCLSCCRTSSLPLRLRDQRCKHTGTGSRIIREAHPSHVLFRLSDSRLPVLIFCSSCGAYTTTNVVRLHEQCVPAAEHLEERATDRCRVRRMSRGWHPRDNLRYEAVTRVVKPAVFGEAGSSCDPLGRISGVNFVDNAATDQFELSDGESQDQDVFRSGCSGTGLELAADRQLS